MAWTEFVDEAERRGACDEWLEWARGHNDWPTEWDYAYWVLRNMHNALSNEQLWTLAKRCPHIALIYCSSRLSDAQFWTLAQRRPGTALVCCADRLTDEQIKQLREMV